LEGLFHTKNDPDFLWTDAAGKPTGPELSPAREYHFAAPPYS
jgi:hypothetical protein